MISTGLLLASLFFGMAPLSIPSEPTTEEFHIGDKAPALQVDQWIKGSKVEAFAPGQIYVVVFWGSW